MGWVVIIPGMEDQITWALAEAVEQLAKAKIAQADDENRYERSWPPGAAAGSLKDVEHFLYATPPDSICRRRRRRRQK
jgi:hypothetical protein